MIKTLNNTIKQDRTAYKIPRSVQDVIPIQRIFADGIFQFGTKYSRTLRFSDINYAIASKEDKTAMFLGYSELLNALDSGSTTKLTICNKQVNRQAFEDTVLLPQRGDSLDGFVDEFNGMLEGKISGSSASVELTATGPPAPPFRADTSLVSLVRSSMASRDRMAFSAPDTALSAPLPKAVRSITVSMANICASASLCPQPDRTSSSGRSRLQNRFMGIPHW